MGIIRPATPGFLVTLAAAVLLAVVSFSVPWFKSIYFLKASLNSSGVQGSITFGTLGYCLELSNGTTCSKPTVGYELDINALVGNDLPIKIPNVVVKWLTYALVLHIVALILAAISAVFGLLAHVREMSMSCFSTCISGFGAAVTLLAFIFDLAFFFIAKSRINSVQGGSAQIGIAIWLTLAAWLLLFFAGCFFGLGRCCIRRRPRDHEKKVPEVDSGYAEQVRLEAVKAEADRKARQKQGEIGLPAFPEYDQTRPLTKEDPEEYYEEGDQILSYRPNQHTPPTRQQSPYAGGYSQAPAGQRAVDDYFNTAPSQPNAYRPSAPRRQTSGHTQSSSGYTPSAYSNATVPVTTSPPPMPAAAAATAGLAAAPAAQYLSAGAPYGHNQYPTSATQGYGHMQRESTYHSAASHQQYPSNYSAQYPEQPAFNPETYNSTGYMTTGNTTSYPPTSTYPPAATTAYAGTSYGYTPQPQQSPSPQSAPQRSYTLGGGGYGSSTVPEYADQRNDEAVYNPYHNTATGYTSPHSPTPGPAPVNTRQSPPMPTASTTSPRAPQPPPSFHSQPNYEDSPPVYDDATAQPPGQWGAKR